MKCYLCNLQEKSHLPVMHVICASFSATTWTDTRGCTAERSRTSVIAAIRLAGHVFNYRSIKNSTCLGSASSIASLALTETHPSLCLAAELLTDRPAAETPTAMYSWGEQRGKPVFTGCVCPSCFLEPSTAF